MINAIDLWDGAEFASTVEFANFNGRLFKMLKLEIVTPERKVVESEVDSVTVPTASGEVGILANHAPLISALKPGIVTILGKGTPEQLAIGGGFVEVSNNVVSVLTNSAKTADEADLAEARAMRDDAEEAIAAAAMQPIEESEAALEQLAAANAILRLAK